MVSARFAVYHRDFCFTENWLPETFIVPLRFAPLFVPTLKVNVPIPKPPLSDEMVIQFTLLVAVHMHSSVVTTVKLPAPPLAGKLDEFGVTA